MDGMFPAREHGFPQKKRSLRFGSTEMAGVGMAFSPTITHGTTAVFIAHYALKSSMVCHSVSVRPFNGYFPGGPGISSYQNVSILDFIGATDDGGGVDDWSYKTYKARQSKCHRQQINT